MKKTIKSMFVLVLVLGLVAVVFSPVLAKKIDTTPTLRDPMVTPVKATDTFTTSIVEVGYLKGAVQLENQLMAPVGRTDEQFGSNGLVLSDLTGKEKAKACFYFTGYNYKWAGNIFKWNGSRWVKQTTTITNDPAATPMACATGLGNGTYALIIYYWGPQEMAQPTTLPD
jgi:hypothetical protein